MSILYRKLARELYSAKGLLLLIASIIAVGVACFVAMQSAYHNLELAKQRYYRQCRMADFWIDLKKVPLSELQVLRRLPGIVEYRPRIQFQGIVDLEDFIEPVSGRILSLPDDRDSPLNDIVLERGDYFTDRRRNEVILNEKFARAHKLSPGSKFHMVLNNRRQELLVVGTALSSEFTYLVGGGSIIPDPVHFGVFYIKRSYAEEVFDFEGAANQIVGRLAPEAHSRVNEVLRSAEEALEPYGVTTTTPLERQVSNQFLTSEIEGLGAFATVVPVIFLAVAALVLNILINRMARRQRVVVGTLKALGYSDRQLFFHFLTYGLAVGLLGGIMGSLLGYLAATGMTYVYEWYFEFPELRSGFYWYTHAVGIVVSLLCAALGSLHGSWGMLRLQPAEAMRPKPPRRGRTIWLEWLLGNAWSRLSAPWRMVLRNLFRHRLRTSTAMFAATMGAGLLVCGFMMIEAQNYLLDFQLHREIRSDIDLVFSEEQGDRALDEVQRFPGVDHAEPILNVSCTFVNGPHQRQGGITGLQEHARLTVPRSRSGHPIGIPDAGLVMTRRLADILNVTLGSTLTIIPARGERRPVEAVVARIADSYLGLAVYADIRYLSGLVDESFVMTGAQLLTDRTAAHEDQLYRQLKQLPGVQSVQSRRHMIANLTETLLQNQYVFIGVLVAFAGVIFFGSIVNASMVNLAEREREVATLGALGYTQWQIGSMFLRETMLTNLAGALLGLPVGYLLTWLTAVSYNNDLIRLPVVTDTWIWVTTLATALLFVLLAHGVLQRALLRMDYLESLKVME